MGGCIIQQSIIVVKQDDSRGGYPMIYSQKEIIEENNSYQTANNSIMFLFTLLKTKTPNAIYNLQGCKKQPLKAKMHRQPSKL